MARLYDKTYYTRTVTGTMQATQLYVVVDSETDTVIAYCPSLDDAERIKALLVYYGTALDFHRTTATSV